MCWPRNGCGKWPRHALGISYSSKEFFVTQSNTPEWRADFHGLNWTAISKCLATRATFAGCISTGQSAVGGVALWSDRQFVKALSKNPGNFGLPCGESELAAVVRAASEEMGLQSILSDFNLFGQKAIKSDATAAIGMIQRLGLEKCDIMLLDLWFRHHVRSGKSESPRCQVWKCCKHEPNCQQNESR